MGKGYGPLVALYTAVSVCGVAWRMKSTSFYKSRPFAVHGSTVAAAGLLRTFFQSSITTALMANLILSFFVLATVSMKAAFFGQLSLMEIQKLVERLINYIIFKGLFLALVAQPDKLQITLWLIWFAVLGFLKVFEGLAKDRLERLNASPAATVFSYGRVFAVLVLVLFTDLFWIQLCIYMFKDSGINTLLLLLFEPLSIAFDTLQAMLIHGLQIYDTWHRHTVDLSPQCSQLHPSQRSAAAAAWEWRGTLVQNCSFVMDVVSLLLALGHCLHIWWLRGLAFKVVDGVLFLNLRTLLSAILKRIKGFLRVRTAMNTLQCALPDATEEELLAYEDDCAICKEPMARAKQLPCTHLFHLPCLRSWLDQGLAEAYSCPTCRRPLFMGSARTANSSFQSRQQLAGGNQIPTMQGNDHSGRDDADNITQTVGTDQVMGTFMTQQWNTSGWNDGNGDFTWTNTFHGGSLQREGSSSGTGSSGPARMHAVMQHLTGGGRSHGESSWSWWPFPHRISGIASRHSHDLDVSETNYRNFHTDHRSQNLVNNPRLHEMVNTVREVLPDVPEERIIQDLLRTNSITTTVNNLL